MLVHQKAYPAWVSTLKAEFESCLRDAEKEANLDKLETFRKEYEDLEDCVKEENYTGKYGFILLKTQPPEVTASMKMAEAWFKKSKNTLSFLEEALESTAMLNNWLVDAGLLDRITKVTENIGNFKAMQKDAPKIIALMVLANTLYCPDFVGNTKKIVMSRTYCTARMGVDLQKLPNRLTNKLSEALSSNKTAATPITDVVAAETSTSASSRASASSTQTTASKPRLALKKIEKKR